MMNGMIEDNKFYNNVNKSDGECSCKINDILLTQSMILSSYSYCSEHSIGAVLKTNT